MTSMIDVVAVACPIAAALAYLAWNLAHDRKPACHPTRQRNAAAPEDNVVIGASLAKGIARAKARR